MEGIPLVVNIKVHWFLEFLVSWVLVSWFQSLLVKPFQDCKVSKIQKHLIFLEDIDPILPKNHFMFLEDIALQEF